MAEFPHLPLFTDAYIADTMHLDCTESGAYLHLLMAAWRSVDCSLPNEDKKLCRMARCTPRQWSKMRETILDFFTLENNKWTQKRLLKERKYVTAKSDQASRAGKASALKRKESDPTDVAPTLQREANGTPTPIPIPTQEVKDIDKSISKNEPEFFEQFWKLYPKQRKGNKQKALSAYKRAIKENRIIEEELINVVGIYAGSEKVADGYASNCTTWLNNDGFSDDYGRQARNTTGNLSPHESQYAGAALAVSLINGREEDR